MKNEVRHIGQVARIEMRSKDGKEYPVILGRSIVYNTLSRALVEFSDGTKLYERIASSAFNDCDMSDTFCQVDHHGKLGRTSSGTVRITKSEDGIDFECDVPDTQLGRDTVTMIGRGDLKGCSFMWPYDAWEYEYSETDTGDIIRTITKVKVLTDVGPVYNPAYTQTTVSTNKRDYMPEKADDKPAAYNRVPHLKRMLDLKSKM